MFLTLLDRFDDAKGDFELARKLAPDSDIAYISGAQEAMYAGNIEEAVRVSREGMARGHRNFLLLTLFGEASLRAGVSPGQKEFEEAREALETAVAERPNHPGSQLALGKICMGAYLKILETPLSMRRVGPMMLTMPSTPQIPSRRTRSS